MRQKDHISAEEYKSLKSEHTIMNECKSCLESKGYYCMRLNSGVASADYTYKTGLLKGVTKTRKLWLSDKGTPDLMAFHPIKVEDESIRYLASLLFVEVKKPGNEPTFAQEQTMKILEEYGARCIVAHSVEELENKLREGVNI